MLTSFQNPNFSECDQCLITAASEFYLWRLQIGRHDFSILMCKLYARQLYVLSPKKYNVRPFSQISSSNYLIKGKNLNRIIFLILELILIYIKNVCFKPLKHSVALRQQVFKAYGLHLYFDCI